MVITRLNLVGGLLVALFLTTTSAQLFLTPLIEGDNISEARSLSLVKNFIPNDDVISYSGFITVNKTHNNNIFFWYFPAENKLETAPVVLWNDGGPGAPGTFCMTLFGGPYRVDPTTNDYVRRENFSWTTDMHMIFIDLPAGVGYSFTDDEAGYPLSGIAAASLQYEFLQQFFQLFPELQQNEFYNGGTSYGGIYSTAIAHFIHERNADAVNPPKIKINLKGLIAESPSLHPIEQQFDLTGHLFGFGLLDEITKAEIDAKTEIAKQMILNNTNHSEIFWYMHPVMTEIWDYVGFYPFYNMMDGGFYTGDSPLFYNYTDYVQRESSRLALHVGDLPYNDKADYAVTIMLGQNYASVKPYLEALVESGLYKVLVIAGNLDVIGNHLQLAKVTEGLEWSGAAEYKSKRREIWQNENGDVEGYIKSARGLTYVVVRNASHVAGIDKPEAMWKLVNSFVNNTEVAKGLVI